MRSYSSSRSWTGRDSTGGRRHTTHLVLVTVLAAFATGCTADAPLPHDRELQTTVASPPSVPATAHSVPPPRRARTEWPPGLRRSFGRLESSLSDPVGISLYRLGPPTSGITLGTKTVGVAWSTSKVPVAIAALNRSPSSSTRSAVKAAITVSDNAAASALWSHLGSGKVAARRATAILRAGGDPVTDIQAVQVRPPYTAFGQTRWSIRRAARFAAHLPCLGGSAPTIIRYMRQVTPSQQWGIGRIGGVAFKGGWGPEGSGYLVRQLGFVRIRGSVIGVAAIADSSAGLWAGTADLDRVASWLEPWLGRLPTARADVPPKCE